MRLFNTKVIPSALDALWQVLQLPDMTNARLLVITKPFAEGSAEERTLQKMMTACKLSADEYIVLQATAGHPYSWQSLAAAPAAVLLLGVPPADLGISAHFQLHTPNAFGGKLVVPALSLEEIERNAVAKKELWASGLKPLFGL